MWDQISLCLPALRTPRKTWVRQMMRWHFSDRTGSSFWLDHRVSLDFDPIADIHDLTDLALFGLFEIDRLRSATAQDLCPRGFCDRPRRLFETGGTTGTPSRIVDVVRGQYDVAIYREYLRGRGLSLSGDCLALTPSGPHAYGWFVARLADSWAGNVFCVDFDPRWVKRTIAQGDAPDPYIEHVVGQALDILALNPVAYLFTTSKLLLRLCAELDAPLSKLGVRAVCTGGTSCTKEEARFLRDAFLQGVDWIDTYGNTLVGHALQADLEGQTRSYHMPPPLAFLQVTRFSDWTKEVAYGERGRVMTTTLLDDLFIPNMRERDSAVRQPPHPWFPWDGVSDVQPVWADSPEGELQGIEGVY